MRSPLKLDPLRSDIADFVFHHPVFRHTEFIEAYLAAGHTTVGAKRALAHAVATRRVERVRRGLYVSTGAEVDRYLLIAKLMPPKAVLSHSGALAFHGLINIEHSVTICCPQWAPTLRHDDIEYRFIQHPLPQAQALDRTTTYPRFDAKLPVTNLARTFVDCLHQPRLGPGTLAELFELFAAQPKLDVDLSEAADHVLALGCSTTAARFGAFLWAHPHWRSYTQHSARTSGLRPQHTVYAEPDREPEGKHLGLFKLILSPELAEAFARYA